tara:strand:- start:323 stop:913 length:591 start_codon:yes stop_codon:yes gene_type:complete
MNKKNQLRKLLIKVRNEISENTSCHFISKKMFERLLKTIIEKKYIVKNLALYYPINNEISPLVITELISKFDFKLSLPKINKNTKVLDFLVWNADEKLQLSDFKTLVPDNSNASVFPDLILIPMLAFDKNLNRIGYGGGYYDATIKFLRKKKSFLAIGIGYDKQEINNVPISNHDQKMDLIVTDKRIIQKKGLFNI